MKRRMVLGGTLAAVGAGVAGTIVYDRGLIPEWSTCKGLADLQHGIVADYQNLNTVVIDGWVLSKSEADLLGRIDGLDAEATRVVVCAGPTVN